MTREGTGETERGRGQRPRRKRKRKKGEENLPLGAPRLRRPDEKKGNHLSALGKRRPATPARVLLGEVRGERRKTAGERRSEGEEEGERERDGERTRHTHSTRGPRKGLKGQRAVQSVDTAPRGRRDTRDDAEKGKAAQGQGCRRTALKSLVAPARALTCGWHSDAMMAAASAASIAALQTQSRQRWRRGRRGEEGEATN